MSKDDCDHGTALPGSITVPDNTTVLQWLAIVWSFLPYLLGVLVTLYVFCFRTLFALLLLMAASVMVCVNEGIVKHLISQARPEGSCLTSKGMPSSHAMLSVGFWWYFHLELLMKPHLTALHIWKPVHKAVVMVLVYLLLLPIPFSRVILEDHSWAQVHSTLTSFSHLSTR